MNGKNDHGVTVLNRLLRIVYRSLPLYLSTTRPWTPHRLDDLYDVLSHVADEHREDAQRIAAEIARRGGVPDPGPVPGRYVALHDLAVDYLARLVLDEHRDARIAIEQYAAAAEDAGVRALAETLAGRFAVQEEALREALEEATGQTNS